jgi:hypothetical protein
MSDSFIGIVINFSDGFHFWELNAARETVTRVLSEIELAAVHG